MKPFEPHHKTIQHYHDPGDLHELTFSCYQQEPLLTNDRWRGYLAQSINQAKTKEGVLLAAFVFMPEHVHLLILPRTKQTDATFVSRFLAELKRPCSALVKADLIESNRLRLLKKLTTTSAKGENEFHYWQEGPGYDRNLLHEKSVMGAIDYIHRNPVRRKLVKQSREWKWSSAKWYESSGEHQDPELPTIDRLPAEFFD